MPNLFARQTALSNVRGRIDYISNPKRQENLLAFRDVADDTYWKQLALECNMSSKYIDLKREKQTVQGRELIIQLSNSLLQRLTPEEIAKELSESFEKRYNRPCAVAIHFNKKKTNLHAHLVYSERERLPEPNEKIATRALFFDEFGTRQYKKSAILDENGQLRDGCRIVKKGEVYERRLFGPVDHKFSEKEWLREAKSEWLLPLRNGVLKGDVDITEYNPATGELPQQHIGNNVYHAQPELAAKIEEYNEDVKEYNFAVQQGIIPRNVAVENAQNLKSHENKRSQELRNFIYMLRKEISEKMAKLKQHKSLLDDKIFGAENRKSTGGAPGNSFSGNTFDGDNFGDR